MLGSGRLSEGSFKLPISRTNKIWDDHTRFWGFTSTDIISVFTSSGDPTRLFTVVKGGRVTLVGLSGGRVGCTVGRDSDLDVPIRDSTLNSVKVRTFSHFNGRWRGCCRDPSVPTHPPPQPIPKPPKTVFLFFLSFSLCHSRLTSH